MITSFGSALFANVKFLVQQSDCHISIASIGLETSLQLLIYLNMHYLIMLQSHAHLRTLRMVRKARPHLSIHSITIRITSTESITVRKLSQRPFHPRPNFEKKTKNSFADENNAMVHNARHLYVISIISVSHPHLNLSKPIIPQSTHCCGLIRFSLGSLP